MKNNFVYGLSNPALRQAQEGVVELHLPAVDMTAMLKEVDREYVKQHPGMKGVLEEERERVAKENRKRERVGVDVESGGDVSPSVKSCDGSSVKSCDDSSVKSCDDSSVKSCDDSSVKSCDGSSVKSCDDSSVKSCDGSNTKNGDNTNAKRCDTPLNTHHQDSSNATQPSENRKKPKLRIDPSSFLNVNAPLQDEVKEEKKDEAVHITDSEIERGRMSEEELSSLPQMRNVG